MRGNRGNNSGKESFDADRTRRIFHQSPFAYGSKCPKTYHVVRKSPLPKGSRFVCYKNRCDGVGVTCDYQHLSHKQTLKDVHLPSALEQTRFDDDIAVSVVWFLRSAHLDEGHRIMIRTFTKQ